MSWSSEAQNSSCYETEHDTPIIPLGILTLNYVNAIPMPCIQQAYKSPKLLHTSVPMTVPSYHMKTICPLHPPRCLYLCLSEHTAGHRTDTPWAFDTQRSQWINGCWKEIQEWESQRSMLVSTLVLQIEYMERFFRLDHSKSILLTSNHCSGPFRHYPDDITLCVQRKGKYTASHSLSALYPFTVHLFSLRMKSLPSIQNLGNKS